MSLKNISANLFVYGGIHLVIDGICAGVIFSILRNQIDGTIDFISFVVLYNILAFGLQSVFGLITDYFKSPRVVTLLGCILTSFSAITFISFPVIAIIFAGLGNALFHAGGGSISLNLTPNKASAPGIYVAPGALGILFGTLLGKGGQFIAWPFVLILIILCFLMFVIKKPEMNYNKEDGLSNKVNYFGLILLLIFISIAVRSLVGMLVVFPWKADINLLIVLTIGVVLGKALGGVIADKFGWIGIAVGALILSIPFLIFGASISLVGIIGMFLFNITMPVTLVAISNLLPGRPGFAFGLTCLALVFGALPAFSPFKLIFSNNWFISIVIIVSASVLFWALKLNSKSNKGRVY
jgi:MFS transporter, FSR family, fosmidomycin resistance protein